MSQEGHPVRFPLRWMLEDFTLEFETDRERAGACDKSHILFQERLLVQAMRAMSLSKGDI